MSVAASPAKQRPATIIPDCRHLWNNFLLPYVLAPPLLLDQWGKLNMLPKQSYKKPGIQLNYLTLPHANKSQSEHTCAIPLCAFEPLPDTGGGSLTPLPFKTGEKVDSACPHLIGLHIFTQHLSKVSRSELLKNWHYKPLTGNKLNKSQIFGLTSQRRFYRFGLNCKFFYK